MDNMWKQFSIALVTLIALDGLWLGLVMSDFYRRHLGHLARMTNGRLDPIWPVAALIYPLLAAGLTVLVVSRARTPGEALALGAFFGLVSYGLYDLTNHSTLRDWPAVLTVVDIAWGTFLCGATAWVVTMLARPA